MLTDTPVLLFWIAILFILIMEFIVCLDLQLKNTKQSPLFYITSILLFLSISFIWYGLTHQVDGVAIFYKG